MAGDLLECGQCGSMVRVPSAPEPQSVRAGSAMAMFQKEEARRAAARRNVIAIAVVLALAWLGIFAINIMNQTGAARSGMIATVVMLVILAVVVFGSIPGHVARRRGHPNAQAVTICAWVGIFTFGIFWLVALVWAYVTPSTRAT